MLVATGFGIGRIPLAPGTWASLAALPCGWLIGGRLDYVGIAAAGAIALLAGWWAAAAVAAQSAARDPGFIVIDEIAAQLLVLAATPRDWGWYACAFLLFRLFDIWKPWPVNWLDHRVEGGLGVMLDDVAAAIYALIVLVIAEGVLGVRP
jgi:phosphatidylglycerophosphatase A